MYVRFYLPLSNLQIIYAIFMHTRIDLLKFITCLNQALLLDKDVIVLQLVGNTSISNINVYVCASDSVRD